MCRWLVPFDDTLWSGAVPPHADVNPVWVGVMNDHWPDRKVVFHPMEPKTRRLVRREIAVCFIIDGGQVFSCLVIPPINGRVQLSFPAVQNDVTPVGIVLRARMLEVTT